MPQFQAPPGCSVEVEAHVEKVENSQIEIHHRNRLGTILTGGWLYYNGELPSDDDALTPTIGVHRIDPQSGEVEVLTAPDESHYVLAASGERFIWMNRSNRMSFGIQGEDGEQLWQSDLSTRDMLSRTAHQLMWTQGFDGDRFFIEDGADDIVLVSLEQGELARVSLTDQELGHGPVLSADGFLYAAHPESPGPYGPNNIYTYSQEDGVSRLTDGDVLEGFPFAQDKDIYWVGSEGAFVRREGEPTERWMPGNCGPFHVRGDRAVFSCNHESGTFPEGSFGTHSATHVYYHDGDQLWRIDAPGDGYYAYAPRLLEGGMVWMEFDQRFPWYDDSSGRVMYHDLESHERLRLGSILAPCLQCEPALSVEGNVVAWDFAPPDDEQSSNQFPDYAIAYAVIDRTAECR